MALVDFHQNNFVIHQIVVYKDKDQTQLHNWKDSFDNHHHQISNCVLVHELTDDNCDDDDGDEQKQDNA